MKNFAAYIFLRLAFCGLSIVVCNSQAHANTYSIEVMADVPKAESVKTIETSLPETGSIHTHSLEALREFLAKGQKLSFANLDGRLGKDYPEVFKSLNDELTESQNFDYFAEGVFVTQDFKVFRWRLRFPRLLEISDFTRENIAYLYLDKRENLTK